MEAFGHKSDKSKVDVGGMLTANNKEFYFDYKNGQYGFNTDPDRGSATFQAFGGVGGFKYAIWYNGYVTNASRGCIYDSTIPDLKSGPSGSTPPEDMLNSKFVEKATPDYYPWGHYAWAVKVKKACKLRVDGVTRNISANTTLKFGYQNTYNGDCLLYFE